MPASIIGTTIRRGDHTVLIIDDNPTTRYATSRVLRAAGFQTLEGGSAAEAMALAPQSVSAVVLDVQLPDGNGYEVAQQLRADVATASLPILHLSAAFNRDEDHVYGLNAGADAYLTHPVEPAILVATVQALARARLAEERLRASEARFRAIYDHAHGGIALVDVQGRFADVNPGMADLLGRSRADLLGRPITDFAPADWLQRIQRQLQHAPQSGIAWGAEFPLLHDDGQLVYLDWHMSPHVEPTLRIAMVQDVTERWVREHDRQQDLEREQSARQVAERHGQSKDDFIAVLSHELRTPLNTVAGWVHILKRSEVSPAVQRGMEIIGRNVKLQTRIIADILDVSRINSGKLRLEPAWCDPAELVTASVTSLRELAQTKRLQMVEHLHGDTSSAWLDPQRFQQICWNLLTNAIKFSRPNGQIIVRLRREDDMLVLSVQDFGEGIDPAFVAHMFDRFAQGSAPNNRMHGGLGLGLSIVAHLAKLHGGDVAAHSEGLGHGATVQVRLHSAPVAAGDFALSDRAPLEHEFTACGDAVLAGMEVLVVEDDADSREMLGVVLGERGAEVRSAENVDAALLAMAQQWPDMLVSDIGLPGKDGYTLVRRVRQLEVEGSARRRLPAIALTAFARAEDEARALEAGFDLHIPKPLNPYDLVCAMVRLRDK